MGRLPNIIIAGVQKCGTSALHDLLCSHPDVSGPTQEPGEKVHTTKKEVHFFCQDARYAKGLDWYRERFQGDSPFAIDSTPEYLREPRFVERMSKDLPDANIIMLMRDPVSRAFSAWNHWQQIEPGQKKWGMPYPDGDFEDNIEAEIEALVSGKAISPHMIRRGIYIDAVECLQRYFPPDQLYFGFSSELLGNHEEELRAIQAFLGLEYAEIPPALIHKRDYGSSIDPETSAWLRELFEPFDRRLEELLGRSVPWLAAEAPGTSVDG